MRSLVLGAALLGGTLALACQQRRGRPAPSEAPPSPSHPSAPVSASATSPPSSAAAAPLEPPLQPPLEAAPGAPAGVSAPRAPTHALRPLIIDEPTVVGPPAPATACAAGVALLAKSDRLHLARLRPLARGKRGKAALDELRRPDAEFQPAQRGPAVLGAFAYFAAHGQLLRARLDGSAPEPLTHDARPAARVAAAALAGRPAVLYLDSGPDEARSARLWLEGASPLRISTEAAGAHSVALVPSGEELLALSLDARTGMTQLHSRAVAWQDGRLALGLDRVRWVAGPAQSLTELTALGGAKEVTAFIAIERGATDFGLATLRLPADEEQEARSVWRLFPNGIDPAPASAASLCGRAYVLYALPITAAVDSLLRVVLAPLEDGELGAPEAITTVGSLTDLSLATTSGGGVAAWVADGNTWGTTLRCPR